jgi:hypothetical protein
MIVQSSIPSNPPSPSLLLRDILRSSYRDPEPLFPLRTDALHLTLPLSFSTSVPSRKRLTITVVAYVVPSLRLCLL